MRFDYDPRARQAIEAVKCAKLDLSNETQLHQLGLIIAQRANPISGKSYANIGGQLIHLQLLARWDANEFVILITVPEGQLYDA